MSDKYVLNGHDPVPVDDLMQWAAWMETGDRRVAEEIICGVRISTVFLGLDHRHFGGGDPLLFQTMTFCESGRWDCEMERCSTWEQAEAQHKLMVARVTDYFKCNPGELPVGPALGVSAVKGSIP